MKYLVEDIKKILKTERWTFALMVLNFVVAMILMIFSVAELKPDAAVVKVGYGDIGGYRDGVWTDMLAFPIFFLVLGVFHNLIAMKIFHKRGAGMTKFFLLVTSALIVGTFIVLIRLVGEN